MPVPKGTVSIMLNTRKRDNGFAISNFNRKLTVKSRFKIKWKTVQWLLVNKRERVLAMLKNFKSTYNKFSEDENQVILFFSHFLGRVQQA